MTTKKVNEDLCLHTVMLIVMAIDNNDVFGNQSKVNCSVTMTEKRHSDGSWYYMTISIMLNPSIIIIQYVYYWHNDQYTCTLKINNYYLST